MQGSRRWSVARSWEPPWWGCPGTKQATGHQVRRVGSGRRRRGTVGRNGAPVAQHPRRLFGLQQADRQLVVTVGEKSYVMCEESVSSDQQLQRARVAGALHLDAHLPRSQVRQLLAAP